MPAKQKKKSGGYVRPIEAAAGDFRGEPFVLNPNEVLADDHPLVRKFPHLFKELEPDRQRPAAESPSAAPGERRG